MRKIKNIQPKPILIESGNKKGSFECFEQFRRGARVLLHIPREGKPNRVKQWYNPRGKRTPFIKEQ